MKKLLLTTALLTSTSAFAHNTQNDCDVNINYDLNLSQDTIKISNKHHTYLITDKNFLEIDGSPISLSYDQQQNLADYSDGIRNAVPQVAEIAGEGIDLAITGVTTALGDGLGLSPNVLADLTDELEIIKSKINEKFSDPNSFSFSRHGMSTDELFGAEFEAQFEQTLEKVIQESMGSVLVTLGQQMLAGDGDMSAFEQRMENIGHQIEHTIENRAKQLEVKADAFCQSMLKVNDIEEELKRTIPELEGFDFLEMNGGHKI